MYTKHYALYYTPHTLYSTITIHHMHYIFHKLDRIMSLQAPASIMTCPGLHERAAVQRFLWVCESIYQDRWMCVSFKTRRMDLWYRVVSASAMLHLQVHVGVSVHKCM